MEREIEKIPEHENSIVLVSNNELDTDKNILTIEATLSEHTHLDGLPLYNLLSVLTCILFLSQMSGSIIATALPKITNHFNSLHDIGWYASASLIASCSSEPLVGKIYSKYPLKWTYLFFLSLYEAGQLLCGTSVSSDMLIVGRAIVGMGATGVMNGGFNMVLAATKKEIRPLVIGLLMSIGTVGTVIGPLVGGALTERVSWRWCFLINLPVGGACGLLLTSLRAPEEKAKPKTELSIMLKELDLFGSLLFIPTSIMLMLAILWGGTTFPWKSATIIGLFCGSFVLACIFLVWENHRGERALIPLSLLKNPVLVFSCLSIFFQMGGLLLISYYLPIWFQAAQNVSPIASGIRILPAVISEVIGTVLTGAFVMKSGHFAPWGAAGSVLIVVGTGLLTTLIPSSSSGKWIGFQILIGSGRGMVLQMPLIAVQAALSLEHLTMGTAFVTFCSSVGAAITFSAGQTVFIANLEKYLKKLAPNVDIQAFLNSGVTNVRSLVPTGDLPLIHLAYNNALVATWYYGTGIAIAALCATLGMTWKSLREKKGEEKSEPSV